jgi:hypothetical protein
MRLRLGHGLVRVLAEDPEDGEGPTVATYCPPCAAREMEASPRLPWYE